MLHPQFTSPLIDGLPSQSDGAPRQFQRARGLRNFLTWAFFLAQIPAMEIFGGGAGASAADNPQGNAVPPETEAAKAAQTLSAPPVQAAPDALPAQMGQSTPAGIAPAAPQSAVEAPSLVEPASLPAEAEAITSPVMGGGGGSASGGEGHDLLPAGIDGLLAEVGLASGDAIRFDGGVDVASLLGDGIETAVGLVDGALTCLGATPLLERLDGLASTLLDPVDAGAESLLNIANSGGEGDVISLHLSASAPAVTDLVLALSVDPPAAPPLTDAPASLLHALPLFGDVLPAVRSAGEAEDHAPGLPNLSASISQIADHAGLVKDAGDLWT